MSVDHLDHVNIRTSDVAATIAWYRDVLGMRATRTPGMADMSVSAWIVDTGDRPIVHVGHADLSYPSDAALPFQPRAGSGSVHHVALECSDYAAMRDQLTASGATLVENDIPQIGLRQLFVTDPNGILIELNFRDNGESSP